MDIRTISSSSTFFYKFILPVLAITLFGIGTLEACFGNVREIEPNKLLWLLPPLWLLGSAGVLRTLAPLKRVRMDEQNLYISNFIEEMTVPLTMIEKVKQSFWNREHQITLYLREDTVFGQKIRFIPKRRFMSLQFPYPVVAELRQLAGITPKDMP